LWRDRVIPDEGRNHSASIQEEGEEKQLHKQQQYVPYIDLKKIHSQSTATSNETVLLDTLTMSCLLLQTQNKLNQSSGIASVDLYNNNNNNNLTFIMRLGNAMQIVAHRQIDQPLSIIRL